MCNGVPSGTWSRKERFDGHARERRPARVRGGTVVPIQCARECAHLPHGGQLGEPAALPRIDGRQAAANCPGAVQPRSFHQKSHWRLAASVRSTTRVSRTKAGSTGGPALFIYVRKLFTNKDAWAMLSIQCVAVSFLNHVICRFAYAPVFFLISATASERRILPSSTP